MSVKYFEIYFLECFFFDIHNIMHFYRVLRLIVWANQLLFFHCGSNPEGCFCLTQSGSLRQPVLVCNGLFIWSCPIRLKVEGWNCQFTLVFNLKLDMKLKGNFTSVNLTLFHHQQYTTVSGNNEFLARLWNRHKTTSNTISAIHMVFCIIRCLRWAEKWGTLWITNRKAIKLRSADPSCQFS